MPLVKCLESRLRIPLIGAPLFIVSGPELVIAQCNSGIVGSFPALNARPQSELDNWIKQIKAETNAYAEENPDHPVAPFAVNQICHKSNLRLNSDLETCIKHKVPIVITSLMPPADVVKGVQEYGGVVFHDVINMRHARKAISQGVDGIITVCAGAGGHAGTTSPFALVKEVREEFDGPIILSGSMSKGSDILAAQVMGADLAYIGTRFIATKEANATENYKDMIVESSAADIVFSNLFTGVHGSYLRGSIKNAGMDPDNLKEGKKSFLNFAKAAIKAKAWKDIWGAGQGVGTMIDVPDVKSLVFRMEQEYIEAKDKLYN